MALQDLQGLADLAKMAQSTGGKEILTVSVDQVMSRDQVRKRFNKIGELAASMKAEGQQSPIIVAPQNDDGKYPIQKGERRWRALKHAGIGTIDVIVNHQVQNALDETAGELIENIQREDLAPVEIADALHQFIEAGWKQKDIATRLGKNVSFVSTHLSLRKLPDCVMALYKAGVCSDTETLNNLRLLYDVNPERCRVLCQASTEDGMTRKESRTLLDDARRIEKMQQEGGVPEGAAPDSITPPSNDEGKADSESIVPTQQSVAAPQDDLGADTDDDVAENGTCAQDEADEPASDDSGQDTSIGAEASDNAPTGAWEPAQAAELVFVVRFTHDGQHKRGIIMTDRVSADAGRVWVSTLDENNKEIPVAIAVEDLQLINVKREEGA